VCLDSIQRVAAHTVIYISREVKNYKKTKKQKKQKKTNNETTPENTDRLSDKIL
jgi:hypothetical protein